MIVEKLLWLVPFVNDLVFHRSAIDKNKFIFSALSMRKDFEQFLEYFWYAANVLIWVFLFLKNAYHTNFKICESKPVNHLQNTKPFIFARTANMGYDYYYFFSDFIGYSGEAHRFKSSAHFT